MTTQEIAARLLHPAFPLTPERFAKAKALALRSKRPAAFLELIAALPDVDTQTIEEAYRIRMDHLDTALMAVRARPIGKTDLPALAEQQRMIEYLKAAIDTEMTTHAEWKEQQHARLSD